MTEVSSVDRRAGLGTHGSRPLGQPMPRSCWTIWAALWPKRSENVLHKTPFFLSKGAFVSEYTHCSISPYIGRPY